jgi:hypothetical protein
MHYVEQFNTSETPAAVQQFVCESDERIENRQTEMIMSLQVVFFSQKIVVTSYYIAFHIARQALFPDSGYRLLQFLKFVGLHYDFFQ